MSADFDSLPPEITLEILSFLDTKSLCNVSQTCKRWHDIIYNTDLLWMRKCKSLDRKDVEEDIQNSEWRNIFISNYGTNKIKKLWLEGKFSKAKSADELPCNFLGPFNVETWGSILDAEISRSGWTNNWTETFNSMKQSPKGRITGSRRLSPWVNFQAISLAYLSSNHAVVYCKLKYLEAVEQPMKHETDCNIVTRITIQFYSTCSLVHKSSICEGLKLLFLAYFQDEDISFKFVKWRSEIEGYS